MYTIWNGSEFFLIKVNKKIVETKFAQKITMFNFITSFQIGIIINWIEYYFRIEINKTRVTGCQNCHLDS